MQMRDPVALTSKWVRGKEIPRGFILDSGYYAGRPPTPSDINTVVLKSFYEGLAQDVGMHAAVNFVRFVNKLDDLSASSFIVAFERFWASDCMAIQVVQDREDRIRVTVHGDVRDAQAFAVVAEALGSRRMSEENRLEASNAIKRDFIQKHLSEIPEGERHKIPTSPFVC